MRTAVRRLILLALGLTWLASQPRDSIAAPGDNTTWSAGAVTSLTLPRGKAGVKVLELIAAQAGINHTLNSLIITRVNGSNGNISSVHLWVDANANGIFEPGSDTQIGTPGPFVSGKKTFSSLNVPLIQNTSKYFWVTVDISTTATNGARMSASLNSKTDVGETGIVQGTFPVSSLGTTASSGHLVNTKLTFVNTVPPADGSAGASINADFQVTYSDGSPVAAFSTLPSVTVRKGGIVQASAGWSTLNASTGQYRASWVVPPGATSGSDYDFYMAALAGTALGNSGPAASQATSTFTVSAEAVQSVVWIRQLLPAGSQPRGKLLAPELVLSATNNNTLNDQVLSSVKVMRVNGADTDVAAIHLFVDTGDGQFTPTTDLEIGNAGIFVGGAYTFSGLNLVIAKNGGMRQLFVAYDLSGTATAGARLSAKIDAAGDLAQSPYTVSGAFPLSSLGTAADSGHLVDPTITLSLTAQPGRAKARETISADYRAEYSDGSAVTSFGVSPVVRVREGGTEIASAAWSPINAALGTYRATWVVPDFQTTSGSYDFLVTASSGSAGGNTGPPTGVTSNSFTVDTTLSFVNTVPPFNGSAGESVFADFQVTFSDGTSVTGFSTLPAVTIRKGGAFLANAGWSTLNAAAGQYRASWVVPPGATSGSDYDFHIQAVVARASGNSGPATDQATSAFAVSGEVIQAVVWIRQLLSAGSQPRGKAHVPVLVLWGINNNTVNDQVLSSVKVTRVNGADSDVAAVHLFVDTGDGQFTPTTDLEIGNAGAFVGGVYTFSGLNLVIAKSGGTRQLFVAYDISGTATAGDRLSAKIDAAGDLAQAPYAVSGTFPLSSLGTAADSGHLVDPTITLSLTAQPGRAKARETVSADYRAVYSDGTAVTGFGVSPVVRVREGGAEIASAAWSPINAALGTYRATWVVPDFQTTSGSYDLMVTASSGSAGGNAGPSTELTSNGFTVDTTLTFVNAVPPANGNAGDTIFADFQVTFSDGIPVTTFSTLPTVTVRKGGDFQATAAWSVLNVLTGRYRASWVVPLGAFSGSDYDFHIQALVARALGNSGPAADQATSAFAISGGATQPVAWTRQLLSAQSQPRGKVHVPVLALSGTNNNTANDQILSSLKVTRVNGSDSDVSTVHLFADTGDGQFTPATDLEIGNAGAFMGGVYTFSGLNLVIAKNGGTRQLFVAYDISATAAAGARLNAMVNLAGDLPQSPYTISGSFPLSSLGTGVDNGHLVDPTITLILTAQPARAKARETVSAEYRAAYSDGTAVTSFAVSPVVRVRESGAEIASAVWSPINAALGTYRAAWVVPDFQATSSNYNFLLTASSGSAGGNFGPSTGLASNGFAVDTQLRFSVVRQPLPRKAGDTVVAEYAITFSDGTPVQTLDAAPTLNVRLGISNVAVPNWSVLDSSLGRYLASWRIPDFQATSPNYNIALFAGAAHAAGNRGANTELATSDFPVDTTLRFTMLTQPGAGTARSTTGCDLQVQYSDGSPVSSFDPLPKVKVFKGAQEVAVGAWDVVKPNDGKYRISWVIPDFQANGPDYVLTVLANSAGSAGNMGPATSHSTAAFTVDTGLRFKAEAQPAAAAIGDDAWMEFTVRRGFDSAPVQQFDRSPTVLVYKGEQNVGSANWITADATAGRYRATWSVPPTQTSGTDYTLRLVGESGTRSGLRGPDATLTSGAFTVTARSLFWGSLPVEFRVVPAGSKSVPVLALLVHNAGENSQVVKGIAVTSLNSEDTSVASVHLHVDEGDQKFASGPNGDPEIGEPGPFRSARKQFLFTDVGVGPGSDRVFFVVYDISDKAITGDRLKASVEQKGDLHLGDGVAVKGSFPLFSLEAPHQINTDLILDIADQPKDISRGSIARMVFTVTRPDGTQVSALSQEPTLEIVKGNMPVGQADIRSVREHPGGFEARWDSASSEFAAGSDYAIVIRANTAQEGKNTGPARAVRSNAFGVLVNIADRMSFQSSDGILQGCVGTETILETKVTDPLGVGVEGVSVAFSLPPGSDPTTQIASDLVNSGPDGMARVNIVIGQRAGRTTLQAIRTGLAGSPLNFSISGQACISDDRLSILVADPVASVADGETPLRVMAYLRDAYGNPVAGKTVQFFTSQSSSLVVEPSERITDGTGSAEVNAFSFEEQSLTLHATVAEDNLTLSSGTDIQFLALPENRLFQSFPNPFDPNAGSTTIRFNLASAGPASLIIYDSTGEPVRTLFQDTNRPAGPQSIEWDGKDQRGRMLGIGRYRGVFETQDYRKSIDMVIHTEDKGCFVATAVYGNPYHPNVMALRRFRDSVLLETSAGRWMVGKYYQWSPGWVRWMKDKPVLTRRVRWLLDRLVSIGQTM